MSNPLQIGTPGGVNATRLLLLGSGELGKELLLEAQALGVETVAVGRYEHAPAMQVAHRSHTIDMTDPEALRELVAAEQPDYIVPEIEAIATEELERLETEGYSVVPTAEATRLTMDRQRIREFAADEIGAPTSAFAFADSVAAYRSAVEELGYPVVVKPTMSSSGKGQSVVAGPDDLEDGWKTARTGTRSDTGRVIIEELVEFDYELTLLTVRHAGGVSFCPPVAHRQVGGDYRESWQPHPMETDRLERAQSIARAVTDGLGGHGIFGVEFFVRDGEVLFSELSPRPHDTGLVTLATQSLSEFELHLRAVLGLPVPDITTERPGASHAVVADRAVDTPAFVGVDDALAQPETTVRLFGKPESYDGRRMAVTVSTADDTDTARSRAAAAADQIALREGG